MTLINLVEGTENLLRETKISFRATGIALKKINPIQTVIARTVMVSKRWSVVPMRGKVGWNFRIPLLLILTVSSSVAVGVLGILINENNRKSRHHDHHHRHRRHHHRLHRNRSSTLSVNRAEKRRNYDSTSWRNCNNCNICNNTGKLQICGQPKHWTISR